MAEKISIRFFNDSEVLTNCKGFKLIAPDGKRRLTD